MAKRKNVRWDIDMMDCGGDEVFNITPSNPFDKYNRKKMLKHYKKAKKQYPNADLWFVGITDDWDMKNIYHYSGCEKRRK